MKKCKIGKKKFNKIKRLCRNKHTKQEVCQQQSIGLCLPEHQVSGKDVTGRSVAVLPPVTPPAFHHKGHPAVFSAAKGHSDRQQGANFSSLLSASQPLTCAWSRSVWSAPWEQTNRSIISVILCWLGLLCHMITGQQVVTGLKMT